MFILIDIEHFLEFGRAKTDLLMIIRIIDGLNFLQEFLFELITDNRNHLKKKEHFFDKIPSKIKIRMTNIILNYVAKSPINWIMHQIFILQLTDI